MKVNSGNTTSFAQVLDIKDESGALLGFRLRIQLGNFLCVGRASYFKSIYYHETIHAQTYRSGENRWYSEDRSYSSQTSRDGFSSMDYGFREAICKGWVNEYKNFVGSGSISEDKIRDIYQKCGITY